MKCKVKDTAKLGINFVDIRYPSDEVAVVTIVTDLKWPEHSRTSHIYHANCDADKIDELHIHIAKEECSNDEECSVVKLTAEDDDERIVLCRSHGLISNRYGLTFMFANTDKGDEVKFTLYEKSAKKPK